MDKVLLVIPAYNEEKNIEKVVDHLVRDFPEPVNLGLAGCFQAGMKYAYQKGYRYAIQFDGDGQHRPEFIGPMKEKMEQGFDIVIGNPPYMCAVSKKTSCTSTPNYPLSPQMLQS